MSSASQAAAIQPSGVDCLLVARSIVQCIVGFLPRDHKTTQGTGLTYYCLITEGFCYVNVC